jgi:hypothetical protein
MKHHIIVALLIFASLPGCRRSEDAPRANWESIKACMQSQPNDNYLRVTKCEPLEERRKFVGTWAVGQENSAFYERQSISGENRKVAEFYLVVPRSSVDKAIHARDNGSIIKYEVSFIGRRSRFSPAPGTPGARTIVLDEILSIRELR